MQEQFCHVRQQAHSAGLLLEGFIEINSMCFLLPCSSFLYLFQGKHKPVPRYHSGCPTLHQEELQEGQEALQGNCIFLGSFFITYLLPQRLQAYRLYYKEKKFLTKQSQTGTKYKVVRNVSTQAELDQKDGEVDKVDDEVVEILITRRDTPDA